MNIKTTIFDNLHEKLYDVSTLVSEMQIETHLVDNCGVCKFTIITMPPLAFWEGATVCVYYNDQILFRGWVMKKERSGSNARVINVTCYDAIKYLEYKDCYMFEKTDSASTRFEKICASHGLPYKVQDATETEIEEYASLEGTLYDGIKDAITKEFDATQERYFIYDNGENIVFANCKSFESEYVLGDASFVTDFAYTTSIDNGTYNTVTVLVKLDTSEDGGGSSSSGETTYHVTVGSPTYQGRWGILSDVISPGSSATPEEDAIKFAKDYLAGCCITQRELKLSCIGIPSFHAGTTFRCKISDLGDLSVDKMLMVEDCVHTLSGDVHTMDLTCKLVTTLDNVSDIEVMDKGSFTVEKETS